jgi:hypothetical protein
MRGEDRIDNIVSRLQDGEQKAQEVLGKLREFTNLLYISLEKILDAIAQKGFLRNPNMKRANLERELSSFAFDWDDFRVIIVPYSYPAFPDKDAKLNPPQELLGRVVYFFQRKSDDTNGSVLGEIYVYPTDLWYAYGLVGTTIEREINEEKLWYFALSLLEKLTFNFTSHHRNSKDTVFQPTPQNPDWPSYFPEGKPDQ